MTGGAKPSIIVLPDTCCAGCIFGLFRTSIFPTLGPSQTSGIGHFGNRLQSTFKLDAGRVVAYHEHATTKHSPWATPIPMEGASKLILCHLISTHEEYSEAPLATPYPFSNGLESCPAQLDVVYTWWDPKSAHWWKEILDFHDARVIKVDIGSRKAEIWWFLWLNDPIFVVFDTG